ncbi:unnamed protein product [Rotaria socialis]|uniref:Uncharacterized protein n=1 Tax=Rotaria socialis TaxID=392032 RepID=A0A817PDY7_9BILA|nr:unnamed protein product [Rotaria socialis]CAF3337959.1 unnamed protein product [Rotaria socialis]CAF4471584.1 unnamed protein product [Rotaria socialis]CAF4630115.1 unnamed protein product [Rotaria socialis]
MRATRLQKQTQRKNTLRHALTLYKSEDERNRRLNNEALIPAYRRHNRDLMENEEMHQIRLRHEAEIKALQRHLQVEQETEEEHR